RLTYSHPDYETVYLPRYERNANASSINNFNLSPQVPRPPIPAALAQANQSVRNLEVPANPQDRVAHYQALGLHFANANDNTNPSPCSSNVTLEQPRSDHWSEPVYHEPLTDDSFVEIDYEESRAEFQQRWIEHFGDSLPLRNPIVPLAEGREN